MTVATPIPTINLPWTDPRLSEDPPAVLNPIREMGPVVLNEAHDQYTVTTYAGVTEALGDGERFDSESLRPIHMDLFGGVTMEMIDEKKRHGEIRGVWSKAFRRDSVANLRELTESVLDERLNPLIERVRAGETVEALTTSIRSIPTIMIAHLLDLDPAVHEDFSRWSDQQIALITGALDESARGERLREEGRAATRAMNAHVAKEIKDRQVNPADDLISMMANSDIGLEERDQVAGVTQLVQAGNETTARAMAHALVVFAQHPEQREMMRRDRSLIGPAIEELLRWETIVQWTSRTVVEDTELAGVPVPKGGVLALMLGAANRDPARWENPDAFDITRPRQNHLSFSFGVHACLGLNLTRLELDCYLNRLLDTIPEWQLAEEPDYDGTFLVRGPGRVVVTA